MADAVGLALGVASLVISAMEHYGKVSDLLRTMKHYDKAVRESMLSMELQELTFRKAIERLLSYSMEREDARQMLLSKNHARWKDEYIARAFVERIGDSYGVMRSAIDLISEDLEAMIAALGKFEVAEGESPKLLKQRIKFAFEKSDIKNQLKSLREKTQDFVTLTALSKPYQPRFARSSPSSLAKKQLERFDKIQKGAEDLYLALEHACSLHIGHQAHLSLEPECSDLDQIRFTLAFSQLSLNPAHQSGSRGVFSPSTWLTVESKITGRLEPAGEISALSASCSKSSKPPKRSLSSDKNNDMLQEQSKRARNKTTKKCVRFQNQSEVVDLGAFKTPVLTLPLVNLCSNGNFCTQLQKFMKQSTPCGAAVGFLEFSGGSKHLVYIDSRSQTVIQGPSSKMFKSLDEIIREQMLEGSPSMTFPITHRFGLAKQLAKAILQFHTTPWMRSNSFGGHRVLIANAKKQIGADRGSTIAPEAYVTAEIASPNGGLSRSESMPSVLVIRNSLLFSLGVMLLEIAYQKPLKDMTIPRDIDDNNVGNTTYLTADRLSKRVSAELGPQYAEITRRCIQCDFGCGSDLKETRLQEEFYKGVICELEKLESAL